MDIINILFKSKIRQKILAIFFTDESRKFYINEMARLVGTTQGTCRRELNKLVNIGMFKTSREGNLQYYHVDRQNPLYKELAAIIRKTIGIEAVLRKALQEVKGINYAFIFGSYAKNEFKPDSDIDIAVVGAVSEEQLIYAVKETEKAIGREINYHIYTEDDFKKKMRASSFLKNIIKKYIMVAGDERAFRRIFKGA